MSDAPTKLLTSTAIFCPALSALKIRSAPKSTYISLIPDFNRKGAWVIIHPSLIRAFLTTL